MVLPSRRFSSQILKQHITFDLLSTAWLDLLSSVTPGVLAVRWRDDNWQVRVAFLRIEFNKNMYKYYLSLRLLDKDSCEIRLKFLKLSLLWNKKPESIIFMLRSCDPRVWHHHMTITTKKWPPAVILKSLVVRAVRVLRIPHMFKVF